VTRYGFVLAGGKGMRLRPYTQVLPKPLIPLGDETIVERVLRSLHDVGLRKVVVSVGYLGYLIESVLGNGERFGLEIAYTHEDTPLGTAGALGLIPHTVAPDDTVLVINGDTLTTLDFGALLDWFESTGADAALACAEREIVIDYGVVTAGENGRLERIDEKPTTTNLLSTGINVFRGSALRLLPEGRVEMPDFLQSLSRSGHEVLCHVTDELWMDLGRVEDLAEANRMLAEGDLR